MMDDVERATTLIRRLRMMFWALIIVFVSQVMVTALAGMMMLHLCS
ncbi:hypothetical protein I6F15_11650 [Bradyrhizobium sp. BRP14]|nr:hypothetical protein [Bradyrhizobium sp. BRP14]